MIRILLYGLANLVFVQPYFPFYYPGLQNDPHMKQKFREMNQQMQDQMKQQQGYTEKPSPKMQHHQKSADDYIDFEEIK